MFSFVVNIHFFPWPKHISYYPSQVLGATFQHWMLGGLWMLTYFGDHFCFFGCGKRMVTWLWDYPLFVIWVAILGKWAVLCSSMPFICLFQTKQEKKRKSFKRKKLKKNKKNQLISNSSFLQGVPCFVISSGKNMFMV